MNFKINSRPLFTIIFKRKNDNFKTRDFSPRIERVLAGVAALNSRLNSKLSSLSYLDSLVALFIQQSKFVKSPGRKPTKLST